MCYQRKSRCSISLVTSFACLWTDWREKSFCRKSNNSSKTLQLISLTNKTHYTSTWATKKISFFVKNHVLKIKFKENLSSSSLKPRSSSMAQVVSLLTNPLLRIIVNKLRRKGEKGRLGLLLSRARDLMTTIRSLRNVSILIIIQMKTQC